MTMCNFFLPVIRMVPTDVSSRAAPIAAEPQVFDLLVDLVQNRDRIVRKDDRLASVRGGRVVATLASRINAAQAMP
jgi:DNA-binding winged helix-turn-helix (wHTH) protein